MTALGRMSCVYEKGSASPTLPILATTRPAGARGVRRGRRYQLSDDLRL